MPKQTLPDMLENFSDKNSMNKINRRTAGKILTTTALATLTGCLTACEKSCSKKKTKSGLPLGISLNCGTLRAYDKLTLEEQIDLVADAGYDGIEPWTKDVENYIQRGGKLSDIKKRLSDKGLAIDNLIGFARCFLDDPTERAKHIETMKREVEWAAEMGSKNIACTMWGLESLDPMKMEIYAERYRTVIDFSKPFGVRPLLELWGHRALHKLSDAMSILIGSQRAEAGLLLDFYHLYRGGNSFDSLKHINLADIDVFHINDYPSTPSREKLVDADRVYPGDGICPFNTLLPEMYARGFRGNLSLEIFNKTYWASGDAKKVIADGYRKTYDVVKHAMKNV